MEALIVKPSIHMQRSSRHALQKNRGESQCVLCSQTLIHMCVNAGCYTHLWERCISLVVSSHVNVLLLHYVCKGDAVHDESTPVMEDVLEAITKHIKGCQAVK